MGSPWMDPRSLGTTIVFLLMIALVNAAPVEDSWDQTALDYPEDGCYYQYQHYDEGEQIRTSEPCLNCTCHNQMLMCYLRVCPFIKPVGKNCVVEKREDQCCPTIMCPEVPVTLWTSTTTTLAPMIDAEEDEVLTPSTSIQLPSGGSQGCNIEDSFYQDGMQVPRDPERPCELCYCIKNTTACVMQECTLKVQGCEPIFQEGVCCPVSYMCADGITLPGLLGFNRLSTESPSTTTKPQGGCVQNGQFYSDGASIESEDPCEHCYCMKGDIVCAVEPCLGAMDGESDSCVALPPPEGSCCPTEYKCEPTNMPVAQAQSQVKPDKDAQTKPSQIVAKFGEPVEDEILDDDDETDETTEADEAVVAPTEAPDEQTPEEQIPEEQTPEDQTPEGQTPDEAASVAEIMTTMSPQSDEDSDETSEVPEDESVETSDAQGEESAEAPEATKEEIAESTESASEESTESSEATEAEKVEVITESSEEIIPETTMKEEPEDASEVEEASEVAEEVPVIEEVSEVTEGNAEVEQEVAEGTEAPEASEATNAEEASEDTAAEETSEVHEIESTEAAAVEEAVEVTEASETTEVEEVPEVIEVEEATEVIEAEEVPETTEAPKVEEASETVDEVTIVEEEQSTEAQEETEGVTESEVEEAVTEITSKSCEVDGTEYEHLSDVPQDDPCQLCQCDNGSVVCATEVCPGPPKNYKNCNALPQEGECCPKYECDDETTARAESLNQDIVPKLGQSSEKDETLEIPNVDENEIFDDDADESEYVIADQCEENGVTYRDQEDVPHHNPCKLCFCNGGTVICADRECLTPKGYEGCTPLPAPEGQCCPDQFECQKPEEGASVMVTIAPTEEEMTTLTPEEGSCLINGIAYLNGSSIPAQDKCDDSCFCEDGNIQCEKKPCPENHIEPGMVCKEFFVEGECCPSHDCVIEEEAELESESHTVTTEEPTEETMTTSPSVEEESGEEEMATVAPDEETPEENMTEAPEAEEVTTQQTSGMEEETSEDDKAEGTESAVEEEVTDAPAEVPEEEGTEAYETNVDMEEEMTTMASSGVDEEEEAVTMEAEETEAEAATEQEQLEEEDLVTEAAGEVEEQSTSTPDEDVDEVATTVGSVEEDEVPLETTMAPAELEGAGEEEAPVEEAAETTMTPDEEVEEEAATEEAVQTIDEAEESVETTAAPAEEESGSAETTMAPVEEEVEPVETTDAPVEEDAVPVETTVTPVEEEVTPDETTVAPIEEELAPVETTAAPVEEEVAPAETTMAPVEEEVAPAETTVTPVEEESGSVETTVASIPEEMVETTLAPAIEETENTTYCISNGMIIQDGKDVPNGNACELCQCLFGQVICAERECPPAPAGCEALPLKEGNCCPEYKCPVAEEDEILDDDTDDVKSEVNENDIILKKDSLPEDELAHDKLPSPLPSVSGAPTYAPELLEEDQEVKSTESSLVGTASSDILENLGDNFSTTPAPIDEYEYEDELTLDSIGPGACLFEGKVYVSAQQIPRTNPCDFCFCFRGDIICLQQSCPPPIPGCQEEAISGFCCPRYECPVKGGTQNVTIQAPAREPSLSAWLFGEQEQDEPSEITQQISGCEVQGRFYEVGAIVESSSGPCLQCRCGFDEKLECEPLACEPQPMMQKMLAIRR